MILMFRAEVEGERGTLSLISSDDSWRATFDHNGGGRVVIQPAVFEFLSEKYELTALPNLGNPLGAEIGGVVYVVISNGPEGYRRFRVLRRLPVSAPTMRTVTASVRVGPQIGGGRRA